MLCIISKITYVNKLNLKKMEEKSFVDEKLESQIRECPLIPDEVKEELITKIKSFLTELQKAELLARALDEPITLFWFYKEAKTFLKLNVPDLLTFSKVWKGGSKVHIDKKDLICYFAS